MATNDNSKIVILDSYRDFSKKLTRDTIQNTVLEYRDIVRVFDEAILEFLRQTHKLDAAQRRKDYSLELEQHLVAISDWLEAESDRTTGADNGRIEALQKDCEKIFARYERVVKHLNEDLVACRYNENKEALDPIKITGYLAVLPTTAAALTKTFFTNERSAIIEAGAIGEAAGLIFAFPRQAERAVRFAIGLAKTPGGIGRATKVARTSFVSAALNVAVRTKRIEDIGPNRASASYRRAPVEMRAEH